uniref:Uncharacterized protein n=1 Tax=Rhizophora mucronata TaxID=61149 RepID=A0A2P2PUZ6_RHIMU
MKLHVFHQIQNPKKFQKTKTIFNTPRHCRDYNTKFVTQTSQPLKPRSKKKKQE